MQRFPAIIASVMIVHFQMMPLPFPTSSQHCCQFKTHHQNTADLLPTSVLMHYSMLGGHPCCKDTKTDAASGQPLSAKEIDLPEGLQCLVNFEIAVGACETGAHFRGCARRRRLGLLESFLQITAGAQRCPFLLGSSDPPTSKPVLCSRGCSVCHELQGR